MSTFDYMDLCRLCLVKDQVSVPIFEGDGDARQIFHKIAFCLPVKVNREDKLPKKICDDCAYKVELCYQFYNTTANAEKQLMQWLGEVGLEDKQGYEQEVMNSNMMKQEQADNRINVAVISNEEQSNSIEINMIDDMSLSLPIIMNQQMPAVSMSSTDNLQNIQSVAGTSVQATGNRMRKDGEEIDTEEDENSEDDCDVDDGLQVVKEESENTSGSRSMESTSYVNVLSCNEAGPSGLQQQKLADMTEMGIQQSEDNTKTGETESFGGLSGMLRQILSPSPDINDGSYLNCCNLQPGFLTNYTSMMSPGVQYIAPMSSPYLHPSHPSSMIPLEQMAPLEHLEVHTESHQCLSCGLEFRSALKLNYHIRMNHQVNINSNDLRRRLDANDNNGQIKYSCSICGRLFPNLGHLRMHETSHQQILQQQQNQQHQQQQQHQQNQQNNVIVTNTTLMSPPPDQTNEQTFNCDRCQASFRYRTLLERHKKIHLTGQDKPYTCPRCPMRFETRTLYNHHAKTHKSIIQSSAPGLVSNPSPTNMNHVPTVPTSTSSVMDKPAFDAPVSYPCDSCTKQFHTIESLTSHKAVHRSRPLVCDVCGKGFTHRKYYVVHQRIHTGERPYLCAMCGKSFTQASTLTVHRRYHTGERPYTCTLCGKGFVTRTIMLNHMKKH